MAGKFDPAEQMDALAFEVPTQPATGEKPKAERPVAYAFCPGCHSIKRTGLVRQGGHLVWRAHTYTTHAGTILQCRTIGARLCVTGQDMAALYEFAGPDVVPTICSCGVF